MAFRNYILLTVAFLLTLLLITGCGVTVTKNYYYCSPNNSGKTTAKSDLKKEQPSDTFTKGENEQN